MFTPSTYKRLHVNLVVDGPLEKLPELADVDVGCRQDRLGEVGAGPRRIVVLSDDGSLSEGWEREQERAQDEETCRSADHADGRVHKICATF